MSQTGVAAMDASAWTVGAGASGRVAGMTVYPIRNGGAVVQFQPVLAESLGAMRVVYEPSVFNGTGEEERRPFSFSIDSDTAAAIQAMEAQVRDKIRPAVPNIDTLWYSSVKGGNVLKAKARVRGENAVRCYNSKKEPIPVPQNWRNLAVVPLIEIRSVFVQRSAAGLVLETVAMIIGDGDQAASTDNFA